MAPSQTSFRVVTPPPTWVGLKAMELLDSGKSRSRVADELGMTRSAVSKWVSSRRQGGQDGLKAKPHPGRHQGQD